jgi:hypothetical protein
MPTEIRVFVVLVVIAIVRITTHLVRGFRS